MKIISLRGGPVVVGVDRSDGACESVAWAAAGGAVVHIVHAAPATPDGADSNPWLGELLDAAEGAGGVRPPAGVLRGETAPVLTEQPAERVGDLLGRLPPTPATCLR